MREILFKAKRLDTQEWVEGDLLHDVIVEMIGEKSEAVIVTSFSGAFPVYPETVCQYTGLTDKNGVKIFEGDIAVFTNNDGEESNFQVMQYEGGWMILEIGCEIPDDFDKFFCDRCKVIGNIHEEGTET